MLGHVIEACASLLKHKASREGFLGVGIQLVLVKGTMVQVIMG